MDTPLQTHIPKELFDHVYEPAEDSFLLLDALEKEILFLRGRRPAICVEVGSGSGIVISAFAMTFPTTYCLSTDINMNACIMTKSTAYRNEVAIDSNNMDLLSMLQDNKIDVIIFNPPYVVTDSTEVGKQDISASWAGGVKGREVTDRLLEMIPKKLAPEGVFYLLLIKENIPEEVIEIMTKRGFQSHTVITRQVRNEQQSVLRFWR